MGGTKTRAAEGRGGGRAARVRVCGPPPPGPSTGGAHGGLACAKGVWQPPPPPPTHTHRTPWAKPSKGQSVTSQSSGHVPLGIGVWQTQMRHMSQTTLIRLPCPLMSSRSPSPTVWCVSVWAGGVPRGPTFAASHPPPPPRHPAPCTYTHCSFQRKGAYGLRLATDEPSFLVRVLIR